MRSFQQQRCDLFVEHNYTQFLCLHPPISGYSLYTSFSQFNIEFLLSSDWPQRIYATKQDKKNNSNNILINKIVSNPRIPTTKTYLLYKSLFRDGLGCVRFFNCSFEVNYLQSWFLLLFIKKKKILKKRIYIYKNKIQFSYI